MLELLLLHGLCLRGLLLEMLRVLLLLDVLLLDMLRLDVLLVVLRVRLLVMGSVLRVLGLRVLLLGRMRDGHGRLNRAWVLLLLLLLLLMVLLLRWGLLGMRVVGPVVDGFIAATHVRLGIWMLAVPVGVSKGRLCLRLHRHRRLRLRPRRLLHEVSSVFLHWERRERGATGICVTGAARQEEVVQRMRVAARDKRQREHGGGGAGCRWFVCGECGASRDRE